MVESLRLSTDSRNMRKRIDTFVAALVAAPDKEPHEIALAAIGKSAVGKLREIVKSDDEAIRFHSARCMLQAGDDSAVAILSAIAMDKTSSRRIKAIETIGTMAKRNDAVSVLTSLLADVDFSVRYASCVQLSMLEDISIRRKLIGTDFFVDNVISSGPKVVYASRRQAGRIILFGSPIECEKNIFVETPDKQITINSPVGQEYINVMRAHPTQPGLIGPLRSGFDLTDVIQTVCGYSRKGDIKSRPGLGISYSDLLPLLRQMCQQGAIKADFMAGQLVSE